ncbi:efflux RND transporter periplasmic adaptor subunit [Sphingosinicella sp. BN140058]|uniref:efflux RND transporter periplasmic adaptor subunit n=1 Tax=Sphingosinicella sp. BN140058 TaxID=1892855 RepID=UPI001011DD62|nr:efflux RND transporter periplasmic adaptor subunit [Sphingosinicella sp. BN140058]QAY76555.1 efflux RND transporter periplasmic adaptor subunit [Sphingosinicella sp. BN140058]
MYLSPSTGPGVATPTPPDVRESAPRKISRLGLGIILLLIVLLAYGGWTLFGAREAHADAPPMPTVNAARPIQRSLVEWDDYSGRFEPSRWVDIKPRVSGQLRAVHFRDGEIVRQGQLLFTLDDRPFVAALNEARARASAARTALALARAELARATALVDDEAISREEVDTRRAAVASAQSQVAALDAVVQQRALDVDFTRIRAPIGGRISDRRVHGGNLVAANDTLLTTIVALDPIHFVFDGSEGLYLRAQRSREAGAAPQVEIRLQDEADYRWKGRVDFNDNRIAADSGTMRSRAVVANPTHFLTPGMFGNMRLASGVRRDALLVPDAAVMTDQARKIVLVVGKGNVVEARPVTVGARVGTLRAIRSGLRPDDVVVIDGVQMAQPGAKVNVRAVRIADAAPAPAPQPDLAPPPSQATLAN